MKYLLQLSEQFIKIAAGQYTDSIRSKVEQSSKSNPKPFARWFPSDDRVYIPLIPIQPKHSQYDEEIIDLFKRLNFDQIDYIEGKVKKNNKDYKIGTILNQLKRKFKEKSKNPEKTEEHFNALMENFRDSKARQAGKNKGNLTVVISQNPHDIAKMSTERGWESCMTLDDPGKSSEKGEKSKEVFCEVENGGLIAYLIYKNDLEIQKPIARVLLRRFDSLEVEYDSHKVLNPKIKASIIVPEKRVYGTNVPGFLETVDGWVKEKQGDIEPGEYHLQGSDWSDTFDDSYEKYEKISDETDLSKIYDMIFNFNLLDEQERISLINYIMNGDHAAQSFLPQLLQKINKLREFQYIDWNDDRVANLAEDYYTVNRPFNYFNEVIKPDSQIKGTKFYEILLNKRKQENKTRYERSLNNFLFEHKYDLSSAIDNYLRQILNNDLLNECVRIVKKIENKMDGEIAGSMLHQFYMRNMFDIRTIFFVKKYLAKYIGYYQFALADIAPYFISAGSKGLALISSLKEYQSNYEEYEKMYKLCQIIIDGIENNDKSKLDEFRKATHRE